MLAPDGELSLQAGIEGPVEGAPSQPGSPNAAGFPENSPWPNALARLGTSLWVIAGGIVLAFCYFASSLCISLLLAGFLAILFDPIVQVFERWHIPRSLSSALLIISGMMLLGLLAYMFYGKADSFLETLPEVAGKIRADLKPMTDRIEKLQESAGTLNSPVRQKKVPEVQIRQNSPTWPSYLIRGLGSVWGAALVAGIVPFLTFFILVRKEHLHTWLLNALGTHTDVPRFTKRVSEMVYGFVVGNGIVAAIMSLVTVGVLLSLKVSGAVPLGIASGISNVIPFLGVLLAAGIPLVAATLQFGTPGPFIIIALTIIALHLISSNLLIPKLIGSRVNIGPVAATAGMLFWGWLWGIMGVLLAVPLTAFVKLVADCYPSLIHVSNLLAEKPRPIPKWIQSVRAIPILRYRPKQKTG